MQMIIWMFMFRGWIQIIQFTNAQPLKMDLFDQHPMFVPINSNGTAYDGYVSIKVRAATNYFIYDELLHLALKLSIKCFIF